VPDGFGPIAIFLGSAPPRANLEHLIQEPKQVWLERSDEGAEETLDIESVDGTKTLVQLLPAERLAYTVSSCAGTQLRSWRRPTGRAPGQPPCAARRTGPARA